jgi:REP element-mobilizing transposase RayT
MVVGISNKFPHVIPDTFVVMPNHFHGIVIITNPKDDPAVGADYKDANPMTRNFIEDTVEYAALAAINAAVSPHPPRRRWRHRC